jgi:hypothetical protein
MQEWLVLITFGFVYLLVLALSVFIRLLPWLIGFSIAKEIWKDDEKEQEP